MLELWDCLGLKESPRIIVALAPLGNEVSSLGPCELSQALMDGKTDQWAAHRYDLTSKHLTTYRVSHLAEIQTDGRSFWCMFLSFYLCKSMLTSYHRVGGDQAGLA